MFYLKNLLINEYLPSELPPCFTTEDLGKYTNEIRGWVNSYYKQYSIPDSFSGFKSFNARRKFSIPNPYHYFKAAECIVKQSDKIFDILDSSKFSLTKPIKGQPSMNQTFCKKTYSVSDTKKEIEKLYQDSNYQIKLDISSCFDSIYTHSISWAMHTIKIAKKKQGFNDLIGNQIDANIRSMNYNQTKGILVGNALSRIVSEIILCTVDKKIQTQFKDIRCLRYVDDYYIFIKNPYEIQNIISFIRNELGIYELLLNENKISIIEPPFVYGKPWVEDLKLYIHLDKMLFINKVINLFNIHRDISTLKYGIRVISLHKFTKQEWEVMESKLLNLWTNFPSLSDVIIKVFIVNKEHLKKGHIKNAVYSILEKNIALNYQQEVIWAVWFSKVFDIQIKNEYIIKILKSKNNMAIIIVLDMINRGYLKTTTNIVKQVAHLRQGLEETDELMWSANWLLAYESDLNGWLKTNTSNFEYAREDRFFKGLIKKQIRFYNPNFEYNYDNESIHNVGYVTKNEFYSHLKKIEALISNLNKNESYVEENKKIIDKIIEENGNMMDELDEEDIY